MREKTMRFYRSIFILVFLLLSISIVDAVTLNVGAGQTYSNIPDAIAAANSGDTISVAAGTYTISTAIDLKNGVNMKGAGSGSTIIYVSDPNAMNGITNGVSDPTNCAMFYCNGLSNVEITGFTFQGPGTSLADIHASGHGGSGDYRNAIKVSSCSNMNIHDNYFTLLYGDGVRGDGGGSSYINVYNNQFLTAGHDAIEVWSGDHWHIYNNICDLMINSFTRFAGATNCELNNNEVYSDTGSGFTGVEYENSGNSALAIDHNIFHNIHSSVGQAVTGLVYGAETGTGTSTVSNNVFWDCPGGYIVVGQMTINDPGNNIEGTSNTDVSYWVGQGYGYNSNGVTHSALPIYNGSVAPSLVYPTPNSSISTTNGAVNFIISNLNASQYGLELFNNVACTSQYAIAGGPHTFTGNTYSVPLTNGQYWVLVGAHDDVHNTWVYPTPRTSSFNVTGNVVGASGLSGTIYDASNQGKIASAIVYVTSATSSASYVTLSDGKYSFPNIVPGTYSLSVYAYNYNPSPPMQVTLNGSSVTEDISLQRVQTYYQPNYVRFVATDPTHIKRYSGTSVYVWAPDAKLDDAPTMSGVTDGTGTIDFQLLQTNQYTMTATYKNVTQTTSLYPIDQFYYITFGDSSSMPAPMWSNVNLNATTQEANSSTAFINWNYTDNVNTSASAVVLTLGHKNNTGNYSVLGTYTFSPTDLSNANSGATVNGQFMVNNYIGETYTIDAVITNSMYGNVNKRITVNFPGSAVPIMQYVGFAYFALVLLFIVGLQFGSREHASGAVILCITCWVFLAMGTFSQLGDADVSKIWMGNITATIYAVATLLLESQNPMGN